jgi:cobalamin biosynthesis protein CbiG
LIQLARQRDWKPEDPLALAIVARQVHTGQPVIVVQLEGARDWLAGLPASVTVLEEVPSNPDPAVAFLLITDQTGRAPRNLDRLAVLRPPTLTLGVATRRVIAPDDLEEAFRQLCRREGFSPLSLTAVAASARRKDGPVLDEFAERRRVPMLYYPDAMLQRSPWGSPGRMAGTCVVSAILAAGATQPIVPSRSYFGRLSLALARRKSSRGKCG